MNKINRSALLDQNNNFVYPVILYQILYIASFGCALKLNRIGNYAILANYFSP